MAHTSAEKQSLDDLLGNDRDKKDPMLHLASHLRAATESRGSTSSPPPWLHVLPFGTRTKRARHKHWGVKRGKRLIAGAPPVPWREGFSLSAAEPPSFNRTQCTVEQRPPPKLVLSTGGLCYLLWADKGLNVQTYRYPIYFPGKSMG